MGLVREVKFEQSSPQIHAPRNSLALELELLYWFNQVGTVSYA